MSTGLFWCIWWGWYGTHTVSRGTRGLLATPFETFERNVRDQLYADGRGFDPARSITAITINRRPHARRTPMQRSMNAIGRHGIAARR